MVSVGTYGALAARDSQGTERKVFIHRPGKFLIGSLVLSALVTIVYYRAVGYNTFLLGLQNTFAGESADYTSLRLESYAPDRYLFPGYVNQFKNVVFPALSVVTTAYLFNSRIRGRFTIAATLWTLVAFAVLGTGQRGAFVQLVLILLTYLALVNRTRFWRNAGIVALAAAPLVLFATFLLGRSTVSLEGTSGGLFGRLKILISELAGRIFVDQQQSGYQAFQYVYKLPAQGGENGFRVCLGFSPGIRAVRWPGSYSSRSLEASGARRRSRCGAPSTITLAGLGSS